VHEIGLGVVGISAESEELVGELDDVDAVDSEVSKRGGEAA